LCLPAERRYALIVQQFARRAVRAGGIKNEFAIIINNFSNAARLPTNRNSRNGVPLPHKVTAGLASGFCLMDFPHQGRDHMTAFQVKIIMQAVEVTGHGADKIRAVLAIYSLRQFRARDFCDRIPCLPRNVACQNFWEFG